MYKIELTRKSDGQEMKGTVIDSNTDLTNVNGLPANYRALFGDAIVNGAYVSNTTLIATYDCSAIVEDEDPM